MSDHVGAFGPELMRPNTERGWYFETTGKGPKDVVLVFQMAGHPDLRLTYQEAKDEMRARELRPTWEAFVLSNILDSWPDEGDWEKIVEPFVARFRG
jgi:hypothetical protein